MGWGRRKTREKAMKMKMREANKERREKNMKKEARKKKEDAAEGEG